MTTSSTVRRLFLSCVASSLLTLAGSSEAQEAPETLPASIPSFGEIVQLELNAENGAVHQGSFTGAKRPPGWLIEFPLAEDDAVVAILETDAKIYAYRLQYKKGSTALEGVPDWKIYGEEAGCDDWRMTPGRHRCEIVVPRLFGSKFDDENGFNRILFAIADKSPRATIKLGLFRGVATSELKYLRAFDALLSDGRQVTQRDLEAQLDAKARVLSWGDAADERRNFLPRGTKAYRHATAASEAALAFAAGRPAPLRPFFTALYDGGENSAVLNYQKLGLAAIELQEWAVAETAFDEALKRIEAIFGNDPAAVGARSNWENEAFKDFKGEPYERAMTYYYRGLLYLRAGDFENASASFRSGEYQDTMSSDAENRSDFGILSLLAGWAERCKGDDDAAADQFAAAAETGLAIPRDGDATLVVAESGGAPIKQRFGIHQQLSTYAVPFTTDDKLVPVASVDGKTATLDRSTSIFLQAATRGERGMDAILAAKVAHGKAIDRTVELAGFIPLIGPLALIAAQGHVYKKIGELGTRADVRAWDSLPNRVAAASFAPTDPAKISVSFAGAAPADRFEAKSAPCSIVWTRQNSVIAEGAGVSGGDPEIDAARAEMPELAQRDRAFRDALANGQGGL